ncbi:cytochrome P450, family 87, subfamily A, polypeptide 2 [Arabidopsis thaliana]|uniref:Cytochrome P450, family 87, subfamily A, polypeptide 2 n=1 Tax=Arabidopsis thaliana TaxID=3702 RepID=F4IDV9_ARATH|nr:cytochrome P450, family 87, subfamily A, polypeptide 2 [Arabidopsis thaliana]AEE28920.1 cytochrome P450, family 87, subfamily A, polypeptide 2 [Arabidopsis thaliana]|eukprot:NP_001184974.1 cytochrome P450, family 87, subfamily A, polypeptide 2 [Arabidopsis thaliana]
MWALLIWVSLLLISITHWVYSWRNPKCRGKLPPGSMGFPLLGESIQFFKPNKTSDIPPFIKERVKNDVDMCRYGPIFKTNLVGRPVIVSTDADLSYFVFNQEGRCFQSWYPDTFTHIFGKKNVGSLHGFMYKYLKNMVLTLFGHDGLKKMLPQVEMTANKRLELWSNQDSVELKDATASMIFDLTAKKLISHDPDKSSENLRANFVAFIQGLISFPFDIPGTAYHKCLQGRAKAMKMLRNMLQERRENPRKNPSDFFDYVIEEIQKEGTILTEEIALDLMFVLLFASFETTSLALTLAIKFLSDDPEVLKRLTEEHETILRNREDADSGLTWEEYKSMTYTFQFINETARLANIVPAIFRKALRDIKFKDYTIPAGWAVMVCPPAVHLNPEMYKDPLVFNPSRWEGSKVTNASKHFMAFGGGMRFCVGTDFTKLQMAAFLHSLVTKYRWEEIKGGNITRTPGLQFPNGYHVKLHKKRD